MSMRTIRRFQGLVALGVGALALCAPSGAAQACAPVFAQFASLQDYNAADYEAEPVFLEIAFEDEAACAGASIALTPEGGGDLSLETSGGVLRLETRNGGVGARESVVGLREARGTPDRRSLQVFRIPPHQFVVSGAYSRTFDLAVNGVTLPDRQVTLDLFVAPVARFLAPEEPRRIDFGDLGADPLRRNAEGGPTGRASFLYQATSSVMMRVTSVNDGKLAHEEGLAFTPIAYTVDVNGTTLPMGQEREVYMKPGARNSGLIEVKLEDIGYRYAGRYADRLTISIVGD